MSAREEVLARICDAVRSAQPAPVVPRAYRRAGPADPGVVDRFAERVADYRAEVRRVGAAALPRAIAEAVGARRIGVPAGLPAEWTAGLATVPDDGLSTAQLDGLDGAVTGCRLGIAETGTIVLDGGPRSGRRALSLVPDWYLCVVAAEQVVAGVPDAIAALNPYDGPLTFVSGPSATSDIELNRVEGVHGPRTLVVLIAG